MLQVVYPNNHILDVGWYGDVNGYIIYLIRDNSWQVPIAKYSAKDENILTVQLLKAIEKIECDSSINKAYYGELWKTEYHT